MTYSSQTLAKIVDGHLCTGCGACSAVTPRKISMKLNGEGYARPVQRSPLHIDEERKLGRVCPSISLSQAALKREDNPLWGPYISVHRGHAVDEDLRHHASSGGALSAFLNALLAAGEVEFVVQTSADGDNPLGNETVRSASAHQTYAAAGSRYAPSSPLADLEKYLAKALPFAFVGKPCDVAALRSIAKNDPRIDQFVPYMVSFFCAGVPSQRGAEAIIGEMGADPKKVSQFQYRGDGWPGFAKAEFNDGEIKQMSYHDSWGKILSKHLQFRCKICPDGTGGFADIVFADAWHCDEEGYPLFEEQKGTSLVVVRTQKGADAFNAAVESNYIGAGELDCDEIKAMQPGQVKKKTLAWSRLLALRVLLQPAPKFKGFNLLKAATLAGFLENLRSFLGSGRRIVTGNR